MKVSCSVSPGVGCALVVEHLQVCIVGMFLGVTGVTPAVTWQLFVSWNEELLGTKGWQKKKYFHSLYFSVLR